MAKETKLINRIFLTVANTIIIADVEFKKELETFLVDECTKLKRVDLHWSDEVLEEWENFILKCSKELVNRLEENPTLEALVDELVGLNADISNKKEVLFSKVRYLDEIEENNKEDNSKIDDKERELTFHEVLDKVKKGFADTFDKIGEKFDKLENKPEPSEYIKFITNGLNDEANRRTLINILTQYQAFD